MEKAIANSSNEGFQEKEEKQQRSWSSLPPEIPSLILSHLVVDDYRTFRDICKDWQSVACTQLFQSPFDDFVHSRIPLLLFEGNHDTYNLLYPIYNEIHQMHVPELSGTKMQYSKDGWLLVTGNEDLNVFFFNPLTRSKVELPQMPEKYINMTFSSAPTFKDCLVVGVSMVSIRAEVAILRRGEDYWRTVEIPIQGVFQSSGCNPILHKGLCYHLDIIGRIEVFRPQDGEYEARTIWPEQYQQKVHNFSYTNFLVMDEEDLYAVFVPPCEKRILVLKWDKIQEDWQKINNLGDKMMFVSDGGSFLEKAEVRGMENKIYFPMLWGKKGVLLPGYLEVSLFPW